MAKQRTYTPAEVCALFGISKSTLFRWEREGVLKDLGRSVKSNQREYTRQHLETIRQKQLKARFASAARNDNLAALQSATELLSLLKLLEGNLFGLQELEELTELSHNTLRQLVRIGYEEYTIGEPIFNRILSLVLRHSQIAVAPSETEGADG